MTVEVVKSLFRESYVSYCLSCRGSDRKGVERQVAAKSEKTVACSQVGNVCCCNK